jgi:hypothetical protein
MTITSVNKGLWTEGITSTGTRKRDRRDAHGTKVTENYVGRVARHWILVPKLHDVLLGRIFSMGQRAVDVKKVA